MGDEVGANGECTYEPQLLNANNQQGPLGCIAIQDALHKPAMMGFTDVIRLPSLRAKAKLAVADWSDE